MEQSPNPGLHAQIVAAFDWWREAGVDCDFADDPADWLARPEPHSSGPAPAPSMPPAFPRAAPLAAASAAPALDPAALPTSLEDFARWWLEEPLLDGGRTAGRVPPRGPAAAPVMVIVAQPEREDADRLLSGPQGRLLDAMFEAMGLAPDKAYVASVLPRHMPHADWHALAAEGFGRIAARHVALVAPARLIVLGGNILPLFGNDLPLSPADLRRFNHEEANIPLLAEAELAALLERPRWKARFWRNWLDWSGRGT